MHNHLYPKIVEDDHMRRAERMIWQSQVEKTFKLDRPKETRNLLLHKAVEGGRLEYMGAVQRFRDDSQVLETFTSEGTRLVQGHVSCTPYNMCLGLIHVHVHVAGRLMLW